MKTLHLSIIAIPFVVYVLSQNAFGYEPCPASGYIHYGPSRQSVPCYLVSLPRDNNTTIEERHYGLNTSPMNANDSKFEYKGAIIVINQTITRLKLDTKEHLLIHPEIANLGNASSSLCYM